MAGSSSAQSRATVVLVTGVSGCGKTTIGSKLAETLHWEFRDADDFHPPANVAKMSAGTPLTDDDRKPWLEAIRSYMAACLSSGKSAVVTCSALKKRYRDVLLFDPIRVKLIYLHGDYSLILARMQSRQGHFMKENMLKSQFAALEPPKEAISIDVSLSPDEIVAKIIKEIGA